MPPCLFFHLLHFSDLLQPQWYVANGGILLIMFVVFAETGLFAGFFLPGDSLLFVAGVYSKKLMDGVYPIESEWLQLIVIIFLISISGIAGNVFGYWFGSKGGKRLYHKKDTFWFKGKFLADAKIYYEKHGSMTIFFARFIPFIRTFAPIVAGTVRMDYRKFTLFNISGSIAWTVSMVLTGHYLNAFLIKKYQYDLSAHLGYIVLGIVIFTTVPFIIKVARLK
ncbi:MAG: VTT domain-containing protein [Saprospiraceae bacterium]|nr:VTT domain-containing protein [Saprospiraceae bacterium]